ncbi:N-(5'-phosphoribosyl)anthranilate isomerase [Gossypium arboreum]|uniref:N-(5'-phosphoribosyl)anthranilate isomerase n=1 Tax=Gossypium arboreum TaxID=29729 RepID=A0A0B0MZ14_GOSAR|nr:N-(5'-phosphoribosyl)anthranilate isomerase [Gossypium arboreum]
MTTTMNHGYDPTFFDEYTCQHNTIDHPTVTDYHDRQMVNSMELGMRFKKKIQTIAHLGLNCRVRLQRVLKTRKNVLISKEQATAHARALVAGYDL